ncbi:MAG TPA: HD-GYP domain-containing protein, partial [Solirubrobacterales bacterium]|nr:HD-GYP domain-containing protein [Solirubrobacterales bacterium]
FFGAAQARESALRGELAASNALLRSDLRRVVQALTGAVAAKDLYTEGHLQRVNHYARRVGTQLGLGSHALEVLEIAGALHDIGKIGIPEHILAKAGPLDSMERQLVERHPEIGARILENVDGFAEAAALVRYHQERWDGDRMGPFPGYPEGIAGEAIPLGARIIAVVDAFDAMTTDRPYRAALSVEEAVSALRAEQGRQFDPRVVEAFLGVLDREPWEDAETA